MTGATLKPGAMVMVASDNPLKAFNSHKTLANKGSSTKKRTIIITEPAEEASENDGSQGVVLN